MVGCRISPVFLMFHLDKSDMIGYSANSVMRVGLCGALGYDACFTSYAIDVVSSLEVRCLGAENLDDGVARYATHLVEKKPRLCFCRTHGSPSLNGG